MIKWKKYISLLTSCVRIRLYRYRVAYKIGEEVFYYTIYKWCLRYISLYNNNCSIDTHTHTYKKKTHTQHTHMHKENREISDLHFVITKIWSKSF